MLKTILVFIAIISAIVLIAIISALSVAAGSSNQLSLSDTKDSKNALNNQAGAIQLTIATVGPMLGPPTDHYEVGEQMPITISMTNTSNQPSYTCVSSDLFQDLPKLTKDGQTLPYTKWQSDVMRNAERDQTCQHDGLPETMLLKANEPIIVDFLVLADDTRTPTGALSWYDPLTPGAYELSIQRRIGCCDGPMIESNKISFAVVTGN
jgi:hypothetical protein